MTSLSALGRTGALALLALSVATGAARAQIADQIVLFGKDFTTAGQIARFDRKLNLLGMTSTEDAGASGGVFWSSGVGVDAQGRYWVPLDPLSETKLLRMDATGALVLPSVNLQDNPVFLATSPWDFTYVLTRVPLLAPAPLYAVSGSGAVLGSNPAAPFLFQEYPDQLEVTPTGEVWIAGIGTGQFGEWLPQLVRVDPGSGAVLQQEVYAKPAGFQGVNMAIWGSAAAPDGTLWAFFKNYLSHVDGGKLVQQAAVSQTYLDYLRVDATGNLYAIGGVGSNYKTKFKLYDGQSLAFVKQYAIGDSISGFALGPSGEDVYLSTMKQVSPFPKRLQRLNLVTGTKSSISLDALGPEWDIPLGDPTGFIWANVTDQQGDADGDGAANRAETLAGSDPFDATSRPEGPKVYISFAPTTNALVLTYVDPDGLLDPQGGLDLSTLSVTIANYGNVFWLLAPFVTALDLSPDGKQATLTYGALPLPFDKKWQVEATIADLTGATGWDWQVTPPGDL